MTVKKHGRKSAPVAEEFLLPGSTGLGNWRMSWFQKTGTYGRRELLSVENEFEDFGGSPQFLEFIQGHVYGGKLPYFWPCLPKDTLKEVRNKARALRRALEQMRSQVLEPHAKQLREIRPVTGTTVPMWSGELRPLKETVESIASLGRLELATQQWPTSESLQPRRGRKQDLQRYFWFGLLVPYTAFLAGEPKWAWIQRWAIKNIAWDSKSNPRFWWRDTNSMLNRLPNAHRPRKSYFLYHPAILFLLWFGLQSESFDAKTREDMGNQFIGSLIEHCPAIPSTMVIALVNFWRELIRVSSGISELSSAELNRLAKAGEGGARSNQLADVFLGPYSRTLYGQQDVTHKPRPKRVG